jgi:hypothetical protein
MHSIPQSGAITRRSSGTRLVAAITAIVALCAALGGALASQASAAVPGLQRITKFGALDSSSTKSLAADCPLGQQMLGAGAGIAGGFGSVYIDDIRPNSVPNRLTATGFENGDSTGQNWRIKAIAICANPLPGMQVVPAQSPTDSLNTKSVTAECPTSKRLIGTGAELTGGLGRVVIDDIRPNSLLTRVTATGFEDRRGNPDNWSVTAYAICADPLPGLEFVRGTSPSNTLAKFVHASCPAGKVLVGDGAEITGGLGRVSLSDMSPDNDLQSAGVAALPRDPTGNWSIDAYAICASA